MWVNDSYEVRAQRVGGSGAVIWQDNGVLVSNADAGRGSPSCPRIESNGQGGAVAIWSDTRDRNQDIFIQGIGPDGALGDPGYDADLSGVTLTSPDSNITEVPSPDVPADPPADLDPETAVAISFTATGVDGSATISLTFESLSDDSVIYKEVNGTWIQIHPSNESTGITNVTLDGNTVTFTIADNGDGDANPADGAIEDPVVAGGAAPAPSVAGPGGDNTCFITTCANGSMGLATVLAVVALLFGLLIAFRIVFLKRDV